jgi:hypothetical protein
MIDGPHIWAGRPDSRSIIARTFFASARRVSSGTAAIKSSTDTAVMAIGGWSGSDPSITLEQFQRDVADGDMGYFISGGGMGGGRGGSGAASEITAWVEANFTSSTVGSATVYVLSSGATGS